MRQFQLALGAALAAVYLACLFVPGIGHYHDDGIYVATAKSLAEGRGYRIINLPGEPPQTKYPILFPALLSVVWVIFPAFPQNVWALKLVPLLSTAAWLWVVRRLIIEAFNETSTAATWIVIIVAASPIIIFLSVSVLAETLFALLTTAALLWLVKAEESGRISYVLIAAALAGMSFLAKTAGVALIASACAYMGLRRRYRDAAVFAATSMLFVAPWALWILSNGQANVDDSYNSWRNYLQDWNALAFAPVQIFRIVLRNLEWTARAPMLYLGLPQNPVGLLASVFTLFLVLRGLWLARRGPTVVHAFGGIYFAILLLWAWPPLRFLSVLMPFAVTWAWNSLHQSFPVKKFPILTHALAIILAITMISAVSIQVRHTRALGAPTMPGYAQIDWHQFILAMQETSRKTPRSAVLLSHVDPAVYLYTGRTAIRGFQANSYQLLYANIPHNPLGTSSDLAQRICSAGVTHLLEIPDGPFVESPHLRAAIADLSKHSPHSLRKVMENGHGYILMEVDRSTLCD